MIIMLALSLSLFGCGNDTEKFYGPWVIKIDVSQALLADLGDSYDDFQEPFEVKMILEFHEDGSYAMFPEQETATENFEQWIESLAAYETEVLYSSYEEQGVSRDQVDEQIQQQFGCSMDVYILEARKESFALDEFMDGLSTEGVYEVKGGKLYMGETEIVSDRYDLYTFENNDLTLILNAATDEIAEKAALVPGFEYPYVFSRLADDQ